MKDDRHEIKNENAANEQSSSKTVISQVESEVVAKGNKGQNKYNKKSFTFEPHFSNKDITVGGVLELIKKIKERISKEGDQQ